jgi:hypothetical protein
LKPSAILAGMEVPARRICAVSPKSSLFGNMRSDDRSPARIDALSATLQDLQTILPVYSCLYYT